MLFVVASPPTRRGSLPQHDNSSWALRGHVSVYHETTAKPHKQKAKQKKQIQPAVPTKFDNRTVDAKTLQKAKSYRKRSLRQNISGQIRFMNTIRPILDTGVSVEQERIVFVDQFRNYRLDFLFPSVNLAVEIDGTGHKNTQGYDDKRDDLVASIGIDTIRFTDEDVNERYFLVREAVAREIARRTRKTSVMEAMAKLIDDDHNALGYQLQSLMGARSN